jgi:predicted phage-related endonuclease
LIIEEPPMTKAELLAKNGQLEDKIEEAQAKIAELERKLEHKQGDPSEWILAAKEDDSLEADLRQVISQCEGLRKAKNEHPEIREDLVKLCKKKR